METAKVKTIAPYLGGKSKLAKTICSIIDSTPHKTYAEPFVGMGGILFRKEKPAKADRSIATQKLKKLAFERPVGQVQSTQSHSK